MATFASALRSLHRLRQRWHRRGSRFYCDLLNRRVASARLHGLEHHSPFDSNPPAAILALNETVRKNVEPGHPCGQALGALLVDPVRSRWDLLAGGRQAELVQAYADRIVIRQDGRIVAEHPRSFGRGDTVYDPWHYVPVLARKPGALRNGAPFKDWVLPTAIERIRRKLASTDDDGLSAVEAACAEALSHGPFRRCRAQYPGPST